MVKLNCWEFKKCGRNPGGNKVAELGICYAAIETRTNNIHEGINGGRVCWIIAGTFCDGKVQGTYAAKLTNCRKCEFYQQVQEEEGNNIVNSLEILGLLKNLKN